MQRTQRNNSNMFNVTFPQNRNLTDMFVETYPIQLWRKYGLFDNSFLGVIHPHWLKFKPQSAATHYILACLYLVIMLIGMVGNVLVITLFIRRRSLRTPGNILVLNLAMSDLTMISKAPIFMYNCIFLGPALGNIGCQIYAFIGGLTGTVSIITLSLISLERYFVIAHPLKNYSTSLKAKTCLIFSWIYGCIFSSIPLLSTTYGPYVPEGFLTSCSFNYLSIDNDVKMFIIIFFGAAWVIPFLVIVFSYLNIIKAVKKSKKLDRIEGSLRSGNAKSKKHLELRMAGIIFGIIALWFAAWTPYAIVALLGISGYENLITPLCSMIPALFCKTASCINPYVYSLTHPRFRAEMKSLFKITSSKDKFTRNIFNTEVSSVENIEISVVTSHTYAARSSSFESSTLCKQNVVQKESIKNFVLAKPNFRNKNPTHKLLIRKWSARGKCKRKEKNCDDTEV